MPSIAAMLSTEFVTYRYVIGNDPNIAFDADSLVMSDQGELVSTRSTKLPFKPRQNRAIRRGQLFG